MDRGRRYVLGVPEIPGNEKRLGAAGLRGLDRALGGAVDLLAARRPDLGGKTKTPTGQGGACMPVRRLEERQRSPVGHSLFSHENLTVRQAPSVSVSPERPAIALRFTLIFVVSAILSHTIWSSTCATVP